MDSGTVAAIATFVVGALVFGLVARTLNRGPDVTELVQDEVTKGAVIVDVRTAEEFASGHVEGALNVPLDELAARLAELPPDRTVVVYCASGARSARAAATLQAAGRKVLDARTMASFRS